MKALFLYLAALVNSDAKQLMLLLVVAHYILVPNVENKRHSSLYSTPNKSHVSPSIHQRLIGNKLQNLWFPATMDLIGAACFLCFSQAFPNDCLPPRAAVKPGQA